MLFNMDYIKILPRCEAYVGNSIDYFRLLTELSGKLNWIRTFFHRAAACRVEGRPYTEEFGEEEWGTAMETLSDVAIKVLGYAYTVNANDTYQKEDVPVYTDYDGTAATAEIWNLFEPTPEDMDRFLCYLNQLIYSFNDYPLLAMSITSPLMELIHSIGGDLEAEIEAELDREEFYETIDHL